LQAFSVGPLSCRPTSFRSRVQCAAAVQPSRSDGPHLDRRVLLTALTLSPVVLNGSALAGQTPNVGTYLPSAGVGDLVRLAMALLAHSPPLCPQHAPRRLMR